MRTPEEQEQWYADKRDRLAKLRAETEEAIAQKRAAEEASGFGRRGRLPVTSRLSGSRYPWNEWTDGEWWEVTKGEHFTCALSSFRAYLYTYALNHRLEVETSLVSRERQIVAFRFYDAENSELARKVTGRA